VRIVIHQIWGSWWVSSTNSQGVGYGTHIIEVRLNGSLLGTTTVTGKSTIVVEANAGTFTPDSLRSPGVPTRTRRPSTTPSIPRPVIERNAMTLKSARSRLAAPRTIAAARGCSLALSRHQVYMLPCEPIAAASVHQAAKTFWLFSRSEQRRLKPSPGLLFGRPGARAHRANQPPSTGSTAPCT